jgi:BlaI family transcriptional regulator, penicillinase repressor
MPLPTKVFVDTTNLFVFHGLYQLFLLMPRPALPKPTDGELAILRVLWRRGPSTVREVLEELCKGQETGYTTVLKMMQIMTEKGLLARDDADRTHVYEPRLAEEETQRQLLGDLLERAFNGSAKKLVMQALSTRKASQKELIEIRQLLDEIEGGKR